MNRNTAIIRINTAGTTQSIALGEPVLRYRFKKLNNFPIFLAFEADLIPADLSTLIASELDIGIIDMPRATWYDTAGTPTGGTFYYASPARGAAFSMEAYSADSAAAVTAYDAGGGHGAFGS